MNLFLFKETHFFGFIQFFSLFAQLCYLVAHPVGIALQEAFIGVDQGKGKNVFMSVPPPQRQCNTPGDLSCEEAYRRLAIIEAVARTVQTARDPTSLCEATLALLRDHLETLSISIHRADATHRTFQLLAPAPEPDKESAQLLHQIRAEKVFSTAQGSHQRAPILIEDLQTTALEPECLAQMYALAFPAACGYLSIPLWYSESCEGILTALFRSPIVASGLQEQVLTGCSIYLAAALAHARVSEEACQEHAQLRSVLDQIPEGVLIVESVAGRITYANEMASHILGLARTDLLGSPFHSLPQTFRPHIAQGRRTLPWNYALVRAFCGETVTGQETIVTRPDGRTVFALCSSTPLHAADGEVSEAILVFQDISAQVSLEQQKQAFLSTLSHELRTPVTAIEGFAELLQMQAAQGKGLADALSLRAFENIVMQSEALTHLIDEMLDLSRMERTQLTLSCGFHDLIQLLTSVVESMACTTPRHHLSLVLQGTQETDSLVGWFDEQRIRQVLYNLITNAIKYSPAGGEVEVGLRWTEKRADEVLLWVRDEGIGIAASDRSAIFTRFYRASSLDPALSGLGIGLYLVKDLVTRHGGRVWVESSEGAGSTFLVVLPLGSQEGPGFQAGQG